MVAELVIWLCYFPEGGRSSHRYYCLSPKYPSLGSLVLSPYFLVEQGIDGLVFYCAARVGDTMMFKFLMFLYGFAVWLTDRGEGDQ
ncbi:hypothetical protein ACK377_17775 [Aeromonas veronii]|uniref:Uncharacterized protein n=1 Tax=Aeromonas veronii TaxID=654 RepID=A0AAN1UQR6_AERVE|nr:hypothetical protein [Aeromonas veronii]AYV38137.1 hypothetical protein EFI48_15720 [Aeromonas veronii]